MVNINNSRVVHSWSPSKLQADMGVLSMAESFQMSDELKRYSMNVLNYGYDTNVEEEESDYGNWVKVEDAVALQNENEQLGKLCDEMAELVRSYMGTDDRPDLYKCLEIYRAIRGPKP